MVAVALSVSVAIAVLGLAAVWPPLWAPDAWRRPTRRLRHGVRRRRYRGIDLKPRPTTASFTSDRDRRNSA